MGAISLTGAFKLALAHHAEQLREFHARTRISVIIKKIDWDYDTILYLFYANQDWQLTTDITEVKGPYIRTNVAKFLALKFPPIFWANFERVPEIINSLEV